MQLKNGTPVGLRDKQSILSLSLFGRVIPQLTEKWTNIQELRIYMKIYRLLLISVFIMSGCSGRVELQWNEEEGYRWAEVGTGYFGTPGFELLNPSRTNITFESFLPEEDMANRVFLNGSGVAAGDVDGDGWVDLYFSQLSGPNKLYKNNGDFTFRDITEEAGVAHEGFYSTGVVFADVDGDGDPDLLVTSVTRENALYLNDGTGHFTLKEESGLVKGNGSTSMALADIDGDGDLDLYVTNYKEKEVNDLYSQEELAWENVVEEGYSRNVVEYTLIPPFDEHFEIIYRENREPTRRELGSRDQLYLNNGDGSFTEIQNLENHFLSSSGEPMGLDRDWGLTAKFQDLNGDMLPDLYVCNDYWTPDRVWINQGDGTFRSIDPLAIRNFSYSSMAVDFSDIDRDGVNDFFVTEMLSNIHARRARQTVSFDPYQESIGDIANQPLYMRNSMYRGREDGTFAEITYYSNTEATEWSWATRFLDVDLDGYEDLIINTGHAYDVLDMDTQEGIRSEDPQEGETLELQYPPLKLTNKALKNNGDLTFTDHSSRWGFVAEDVSHGLATADYDHDGDLDLVVSRLNDKPAIYRNTTNAPRIGVRLIGKAPNTQAIGAKITLTGGPAPQKDQVVTGGEYISGSDPFFSFAADPDNDNHGITIRWPDGTATSIDSVAANRIYEIRQSDVTVQVHPAEESTEEEPVFVDVSDRIDHRHHEEFFNDYNIQPLLPVKLSQQGPGVSWIDYDSDGDDDLFVAGGKGGRSGLFENDGEGNFTNVDDSIFTGTAEGDRTTILGLGTGQGMHLVVGNANLEADSPDVPSVYHYLVTGNGDTISKQDSLPGIFSTTGALASVDYDGDGDLDLFVGGRFHPARYPSDADSRLFLNENGSFVLDEINSQKFRQIGLVTGAVFTDIDGDGDQDLLLSREWDSLLLFKNEDGNFQNVSEDVGLDRWEGWWNGITTGDFNNDGLPDIVATNLGLNSVYQLDVSRPLRMYYDDFDGDRRLEILEAYYHEERQAYVPRGRLHEMMESIGNIKWNIQSHEEFGNASVHDLVGRNINESNVPHKTINILTNTLFLNTGSGFEARELPDEAQFTAGFYAGTADFNNDGNEDLFLSQNLFSTPRLVPRLDAGRGLWLRGDGTGNFQPVTGSQSGIKVYGEQRGAALGDFNSDGRVDLAVSQNGAATKLYWNQTEKRGITVRLLGPASNTAAIGSGIRLIYDDGRKGPLREVQAGSGYWSQNSTTQVLGYDGDSTVEAIEVQWFDGTMRRVETSPDQDMYQITYPP